METISAIKWHKNILQLGDKAIVFDDNIDEVIECAEVILVITDWQAGDSENLYGVLKESRERWRIQRVTEKYGEVGLSVYVNAGYRDGKLIAFDFMGRRFIVNPLNGRIEGRLELVRF